MKENFIRLVESAVNTLGSKPRDILITISTDEFLELPTEYASTSISRKAIAGVNGNIRTYKYLGLYIHFKIDPDLR